MKQIKNIAFDLGGVVLALSLEGGIKGFEKIGVRDARQRLDAYQQKGVFADLESGRISKEEFREEMCRLTGKEITLQDCFEAWHGYVDYVTMCPSRILKRFSVCGKKAIRCVCFQIRTPL